MSKPIVIRGDAYITYSDAGGTSYRLDLASPFREITPQFFDRRYRWASADETAFNVVSVGSGVQRFTARLRYEGDALALLRMLDAGADDQTLTYYDDADDTRFVYTLKLVNAGELIEVAADPDLWFDGRYEATAVFQRTDSPDFDDLLSDLLYGVGTEVFVNDDGTEITFHELGTVNTTVYLKEDGTHVTIDTANDGSATARLYGGSLLIQEE